MRDGPNLLAMMVTRIVGANLMDRVRVSRHQAARMVLAARVPRPDALLQATFVAGFLAALVLPLAQTIVPIFALRPVNENRVLAPPPDISGIILHGDGRLASATNAWFDDRMGFRPLFIRLHNQIDYSLFHHSDKVYVGREGMLFARTDVDKKAVLEARGQVWQRAIRAAFERLARHLNKRGVRLVIVSNPDKASVYPDLLPRDAPRLTGITQFNALRSFLAAGRDWLYVDGQDEMKRCGSYRLFYLTDVHSTTPAIYCLAKQIVSRIAAAEGRSGEVWSPSSAYAERMFSGVLADFLAVLFNPIEQVEEPVSPYLPGQPVPDGRFDAAPPAPFETIYRADDATGRRKLPPLVLYGNSFVGPYLSSGFYFQFAEVYWVRSNGIPIETVLDNLPPEARYMVVQFWEPYLDQFLQYQIPD
jgi:hypothetical protein